MNMNFFKIDFSKFTTIEWCVTALIGLIVVVNLVQQQWGNLLELLVIMAISFSLGRYLALRKDQHP